MRVIVKRKMFGEKQFDKGVIHGDGVVYWVNLWGLGIMVLRG